MKKFLLSTIFAVASAGVIHAADMPVKAPVLSFQYPTGNGWYGFVGTEGGGGNANVSAPGVNANSLVTNQIDVNIGGGYAWNIRNTSMFTALEASAGYTDFNGSQQGLSFSGPLVFEIRWLFGAPVDQIAAYFPSFGVTMPTFPVVSGQPAPVSSKFYIAPSVKFRDESLNFGATSNKVWGVIPGITPVGALWQLPNGQVIDTYTQIDFIDRSNCFGSGLPAGGIVCGKATQQYMAGVKYKFGI